VMRGAWRGDGAAGDGSAGWVAVRGRAGDRGNRFLVVVGAVKG
jgi:hypothetical protein